MILSPKIMVSAGITAFGLNGYVSAQQQPNILFILIDDMGYPAIETYGNKFVKTPHINSLAQQGMSFEQAYACPQSTPTRASLLTGQYTARNKMWHVVPYYGYPKARVQEPKYLQELPREQFTVAEALKTAGYNTAMIGKWHLSTYDNDGYYTYLYTDKAAYYGFNYVLPFQNPREYQSVGDKGVDMLTSETMKFMEKSADKPFFVYLSHHTVHQKVLAPEYLVKKYRELGFAEKGLHSATYMAAIEHLDNSVGKLIEKLKQLGKYDNTIIFFVSDNGGVDYEFDNAPLRAGKGSAYEGGTRVPFIVKWPQVTTSALISQLPVHVVDVYPTMLEMAGIKNRAGQVLDGKSIVPLLKQNKSAQHKFSKRPVYFYQPLYDPQWGAAPSASMVLGDYKILWFFGDYIDVDNKLAYTPEGRVELYNLKTDLSETTDLSAREPRRTKAMKAKLTKWILKSGAEIPTINPNFDINKWTEIDTSKKEE